MTYTPDGRIDAQIQAHLDQIVADLRDASIATRCHALALGGGYGRGEGGTWRNADGTVAPYNDYDLVVIHADDASADVRAWIATHQSAWQARAGIHVDVEPVAISRVANLPAQLTWYELGQGHQVLWGNPACLEPLRQRHLDGIAAEEWGRLLVNRGIGLIFAHWRLGPPPHPLGGDEHPERFAERQVQKAWLALGDVLLAERGVYHHLLCERQAAMERLSDAPLWRPRWQAAAAAKFAPQPLTAPAIVDDLAQLAPLYAQALAANICEARRPLVHLVRAWQHLPLRPWLRSLPWTGLRERLRHALMAHFNGDLRALTTAFGNRERVTRAWKACA